MDECTFHILYRIKPYPLIIPLNYPHPLPTPPRLTMQNLAGKLGHVKEYFAGRHAHYAAWILYSTMVM